MAKEKVFKLAQEFKVSSEALVQMLRTMGIPVKSHMSTVDESLRDSIKLRFEQERAEIKKEYDRKKQMISRAREEVISRGDKPEAPAVVPAPAPVQPAAVAPAPVGAPGPAAAPAPVQPGSPTRAPAPAYQARPAAPVRPVYDTRRDPFTRPAGTSTGRPMPPPVGAPGIRRPEYGHSSSAPHAGHAPRAWTDTAAMNAFTPPPPGAAAERGGIHGKGKKKPHPSKKPTPAEKAEIDVLELKSNVKRTLAKIGSGSERKRYTKKDRSAQDDGTSDDSKMLLNVSEFVTANELSVMMHRPVSEVIAKCLELGLFVTINQRLDFETIALVADEFGFTAQLMDEYEPDTEEAAGEEDKPELLKPRAPVVTIMGHVDHGKTSLLDHIRKTNVIAGEAGGITQHIAAYEVQTAHGAVTFLDTPGHQAFTAMRARGAQITDVIVLVVAADSGVMPQTKEAIDHARAANVPVVVAMNKMDLPSANPDKVKGELAQYNMVVDDYGGTISCIPVSAKTGMGFDKLLETLALETEILNLKANPIGKAHGVVVEAELDKGKGPLATVLVQKGTLKRGDAFVTGMHSGRVRDLLNERGQSIEEAGPSRPVIVLGMDGVPQAGDSFRVVEDEKEARAISIRRRLAQKERELRKIGAVSLDHLYEQIQAGKVQTINLIIKGDVDGSVEALASSLEQLSNTEIKVRVIHKSVGAIKETDVMLAAASKAVIIGFHLSPNSKIREMAKNEGAEIRTYRIIYEALDAVKKAMEGMLAPEVKENVLAQVEVRKVFRISKVGNIAGCIVTSGTVTRNMKARLIRDDVEIIDSKISSLKRNTDDVREVTVGHECGISLDRCNDYKEGDRIECYEEIQVARKLEQVS